MYWQHGQSTETDFIYVTTQTLTKEQLDQLTFEVGRERTLLICCGAFRTKPDAYPNLTLKKIPNSVLHRCEWGKDDYSLAISELMPEADDPVSAPAGAGKASPVKKKKSKSNASAQTLPLFGRDEDQGKT